MDTIEFYNGENLITRVASSMTPPINSKISILGQAWEVVRVTFAIDQGWDNTFESRSLRANVDLFPWEG